MAQQPAIVVRSRARPEHAAGASGIAAWRSLRVPIAGSATQNIPRMPDQPVKVAMIERATCGALIEVFTLSGMPGLGWVVTEPDLCPLPPLTAR